MALLVTKHGKNKIIQSTFFNITCHPLKTDPKTNPRNSTFGIINTNKITGEKKNYIYNI